MSLYTAHTPGPWTLHPGGCAVQTEKVMIASCGFYPYSHIWNWKANARLISAAPDLLSTLETCLKNSEMRRASGFESGPMIDREIEIARAAIAKATGKEGLE